MMGETVPKRVRDIVLAVYRVGDPEHNDRALEDEAVAAVKGAVAALARTDDEYVRRQLRTLGDERWLSFHTADGVTRWGVGLKAVRNIGLATLKEARAQSPGQPVPASSTNDGDEPATPQPTPAPNPPSSYDQSEDGEVNKGGDNDNGLGERQQQQVLSAVSASAGADGWAQDSAIFAALTQQSQWFGAPWYRFTSELRNLVNGGHLERGKGKRKGHYRLADGAGESGAEPAGLTQGEGEDSGQDDDTKEKGDGEMPGSNATVEESSGGRMTYEARRRFGWDNTPGDTQEEKMAYGIPVADIQRIFGLGTPGSVAMYVKRMVARGDLRRVTRGVYGWAVNVGALDDAASHADGEGEPEKKPKPGPKKGGAKKPKAGKKGQARGKPPSGTPSVAPSSGSAAPSAIPAPVPVEGGLEGAFVKLAENRPWLASAVLAAKYLEGLTSEQVKCALAAITTLSGLMPWERGLAMELIIVIRKGDK